jgi:hypothetical protein
MPHRPFSSMVTLLFTVTLGGCVPISGFALAQETRAERRQRLAEAREQRLKEIRRRKEKEERGQPAPYVKVPPIDTSVTPKAVATTPVTEGGSATPASPLSGAGMTKPDRANELAPPGLRTKSSSGAVIGGPTPTAKGGSKPALSADRLAAMTPVDVLRFARSFHDANPDYSCIMDRQELTGGRMPPVERLLVEYRRQPEGVYYKWLDARNTGREAVWQPDRHQGAIITRGGKGDFILNGRVMRIDPDNILARGKSRYTIHESGIHRMLDRLASILEPAERGDVRKGSAQVDGLVAHPELPERALGMTVRISPGWDPVFPKGATRKWYFDPADGRLLLMLSIGPDGTTLEESYRFSELQGMTFPADRFEPERVEKRKPD